MTRSAYILGGAGAGKSTFTAALLDEIVMFDGPLVDLHAVRNRTNLVTLRGHELLGYDGERGLYLGVMRESFPGTDGLDRASSQTGVAWLHEGALPSFIVAEGATLATRPFLGALAATTELLVVHLVVPDEVRAARFAERGSNQAASFVRTTVTRSANRYAEAVEAGQARCLEVDTSDPDSWDLALGLVGEHLLPEL